MGPKPYPPIAIVGIGCRFPGGIASPRAFWDFLAKGGDGIREVPPDRWSIEKYYDDDARQVARIYTRRGGFLDDVSGFDPQFFGISPREASYLDPQQRLLLETTWEAFEDAGIAPSIWAGRKVGVFVGLFTHDYENIHMRVTERGLYGPHSATGMSTTIAANRLSHAFDFKGPSMVIDTACSSSLVAVHLACRSLHEGESDLAVAGGVNLQLSPEMTMSLCKASMLAPDGYCKSFDARANGYTRADGAGMVVLKPLAKALADGDAIYAVIRGSAVNQDGRDKGLTVPNGASQQQVMQEALARARVLPSEISYVEAHGTGTPVGDPIEANALGSVLRSGAPDRAACAIGSVKSNFGHTESAAGIAGLIKVALMQRQGSIPANLHFETPNPEIPFDQLRLRVPTVLEEWDADGDGRRLAGVNSFGFGGTNAHVVVANAPAARKATPRTRADRALMLCLSARSEGALQANARQYGDFLRAQPGDEFPLEAVAAELALGREHHSVRLTVAGQTRHQVADLLDAFVAGHRRPGLATGTATGTRPSELVFVCSGMGQQWWAMGRGLAESEPVFAEKLAELDGMFRRMNGGWSLREILAAGEASSLIDRTDYAQPAIFSLQVALAALWESWGVRPGMVVGHSIGEVAAAYIAGALSLEDAVKVCFHRSRLQAGLAGRGGMLAVGMSASSVQQRIRGLEALVSIAAVNSPNSVTLAGDIAALERLAAELKGDKIFARRLNVELPYHSPVMDEIGAPFRAALQGLSPRATDIPLISTVTGGEIDGSTLDADYWNRNIREPVFFGRAMKTLADLQGRAFVEIGAHPVLASSIGECLAAEGVQGAAIASLRRGQDDATTFLGAVGQLHCQGYSLDFGKQFEKPSIRMDLPTYPWQRSPFWTESAESRKVRTGIGVEGARPDHPLLGERLSSPQPAWHSEVNPHQPRYLEDHRVQGSVVFPGAGFIEMALAAADGVVPTNGPIAIERLSIEAPLVLAAASQTRLQFSLDGHRQFQIHSLARQEEGEQRWTRHVSGVLTDPTPSRDLPFLDGAILHDRLSDAHDQAAIYRRFDMLGLHYGPQFRRLEAAWTGEDEALGRIVATPEIEAEIDRYKVHPALLDAAFQLLAILPGEGTYLPVGVERVEVHQPGASAAWAYVRKVSHSGKRIVADISMADEEGQILVSVSGLTCQHFADAKPSIRASSGTFLYDRMWIDSELADSSGQRRSDHIPSPSVLGPVLQERHDRRNAERRHEKFVQQAWPALDALATSYFVDALSKLGWDWQGRGTFTAEGLSRSLGIAPRHFRLVGRMLGLLEQSGYLKLIDAHWLVREAPPVPCVEAEWRALALAYPECHAELNLTRRCGSRLVEFLRDEEEPLSALFPSGSPIAEHMYSDSPTCEPYNRIVADAVAEIVRQLPEGETLRVLEVGAGTGGLTSLLLPLLPAERTDYVFTDVSQSFLNQAKERFRAFPFVRYEVLDVEEEPCEQGFAEESFDLIVICDAVHATADLRRTLGGLHALLAPGGMLALMEMTTPPRWCDLVFGLLPGWWAFTDTDLRPGHATLPASAWLSVLAECGYGSCATISDRITDDKGSLHSVILARRPDDAARHELRAEPALRQNRLAPQTPIVLLADSSGLADKLAERLHSLGRQVILGDPGWLHSTSADGSPEQVIVAAAGPEMIAPVVVDMRGLSVPGSAAKADCPSIAGTTACVNLQDVVRVLSGRAWQGRPGLWVVTCGTETVGGVTDLAPEQAPVRGFARVVKNEHAELDVLAVDLSPEPGEMELAALAQEILAAGGEDEIALRGNRKYVNRVVPHRNRHETDGRAAAFRLTREGKSSLDSLVFQEVAIAPPGPGQVQVRVCAAGLNFKDFASHAGLIKSATDSPGLEGAGIVTAVGEGVEQWRPGDHVMGLIDGSLSNPVNTDARLLARKPANLSFEDAAGIPVVYLSAWQALKKQARLAAGETVLIHTAAGGLGLASLQVARALGAKVLATAGNEEKRDYLHACGVDYVGDSRSGGFAEEIMALTAGKGVDVVLNTLPAAMNQHNIRLLRPGGGRLVDMTNMHSGAQLDYVALQKGILFSAFDLAVLAGADPVYISGLLAELVPLFERGTLRPAPYRRTPLERIAETVRSFRRAAHIGKFVVSVADSAVDMVPAAGDMPLRGDASYLVSGGLSGFGLSTALRLAKMGARHLVLVGRRGAATPEAATALADLRAAAVDVHAVAADVADPAQMQALVARFGREWPTLHGIVHSAMVLRDGPMLGLTREQIRSVLAPKIDGAWNLHRFTLNQPLDFFIFYSSMSALLGNRDQANYAAANEYLEALARHRRAIGLPALSIGWGAIGATGYVARDERIQDVFVRQGMFDLGANEAWTAVAQGLRAGTANLYAAALDWSTLRQFSRTVSASPRFGLLRTGSADQASDKDARTAARAGLDASATPEERYRHVRQILAREVSGVLGIDPQSLDLARPLQNLGFDSLMAVELIVAVERATGYGLTRMSLLRSDVTTMELIAEVAGVSGGKASELAAETSDEAGTAVSVDAEMRIDDLSDHEVDVLLRELATEELSDG